MSEQSTRTEGAAALFELPESIEPAEFFALVQAELSELPPAPRPIPQQGTIVLEGEGGGEWTFAVRDGRPDVRAGAADAPEGPIAVCTMTTDSWRAFVAGRVRDAVKARVGGPLPVLDPADADRLYERADKLAALGAIRGKLHLVLEDSELGLEYGLQLATGAQGGAEPVPAASVSIGLDDAIALAAGSVSPQEAFFEGKLRIDGDMNYVMGLMTTAMAE